MPTYSLLPAQREFIHVNPGVSVDICCYQGGFGSGKTWIGSLLGLCLAKKYPGKVGLVVAKTYPLLRDTTLRQYLDHLDKMGFREGVHYKYAKTDAKLIFMCYGGSEIWFRHLENSEKLKSINAAWIEIEEASLVMESDFTLLLSRLRQDVPRLRMFMHTNPEAAKGWIYKHFVSNNKGPQEIDLPDGRKGLIEYRRIIAPTHQNAANLPPGYIANMESAFDPEYYRINVLGQDGDYTSGLVCKTWNFANIDESVVYDPQQRVYLTCDFNVDPMCWALAHRFNGEYHFFDELCRENTNIVETVGALAKRYVQHRAGIVITGDASGNQRSDGTPDPNQTRYDLLLKTMSDYGFTNYALDVARANPQIETRIEVWNSFVCNQKGERRIKVSPKCQQLIHICENLKYIPGSAEIWKPTPKQIEQDRSMKFLRNDMFDAASYLVYRFDPQIKPDARKKIAFRTSEFNVA